MSMTKKPLTILHNNLSQDEDYNRDINDIHTVLAMAGYEVSRLPVDGNVEKLISDIKLLSPMCIFNLCEEVKEDSWGEIYIAGLLELLGIPYTGTGPYGLALCLDKAKNKDILSNNGIKVPAYQVCTFGQQGSELKLSFPVIMKPLHEDGSYGIVSDAVVTDKRGLEEKTKMIYEQYGQPAIAEEYIKGREFNVSILGNGDKRKALPLAELDFSNMPLDLPRICSYRAKWTPDSAEFKGTSPICPVKIRTSLRHKMESIALDVCRIINCCDYARVDMRMKDDETIYVIDVNPNPCISPDAGFVKAAQTAGMDYGTLINEIVNICLERKSGVLINDAEIITTG